MPSGKSKEATWSENELSSVLKTGESKEKKHRSSKEKSTRDKSGTRGESLKEKETSNTKLSKQSSSKDPKRQLKQLHSREDDRKSEDRSHRERPKDVETKHRSQSKHRSEEKVEKRKGTEKTAGHSKVDKQSRHHDKKKEQNRDERKHSDTEKKRKRDKSKDELSKEKNERRKSRSRTKSSESGSKSGKDGQETENNDIKMNAEDEYNYDGEQFDDYGDDDFEEDSGEEDEEVEVIVKENEEGVNSEDSSRPSQQVQLTESEKKGVDEVMTAISAENEMVSVRAGSSQNGEKAKLLSEKDTNKDVGEPATTGKMDFAAANKKQINNKIAEKTKQRGEVLLQLIQLDVRSFELFEMSPLSEYELYMKRFGQSDAKQMCTQTNDDDKTQDVQTDEIETESRWCQHSHDLKACGIGDEESKSNDTSLSSLLSTNSVRLNKFLIKASKVCISLLEELEAGIEQPQRRYTEYKTVYSDGYVTLSSSDFLVLGRTLCDVAYSTTQTNILLTAYGPSNVMTQGQKSPKGLLCVWNTNEPNKPHMMLTCEAQPTSCCLSTGKANLAFAGMTDGVVAVWDLREPDSFHNEVKVGNTVQIFRTATYTTAANAESHLLPIVSITPLVSHMSSKSSSHDGIDISFQLASIDESGAVFIWILVEVHVNAMDLSTINDNLGLSPKGTIKLLKSGVISPPNPDLSFGTQFFVTCLQVGLTNPNHLYVGTDQGEIVHRVRFGKRATPKCLRNDEDCSVCINSLDLSPWRTPYILAAYKNGVVRIFNLKQKHSLLSWSHFSNGNEIIDAKWSRSKPNVFFALDAQSVLYAWDILKDESHPVLRHQLQRKDKRAIGFSFANDYASLGVGTPGRAAEMAVVYGDGSVEIHRLAKKLALMEADEYDRVQDFLEDIT